MSHAHIDHIGGAKYLQENFGTRIVMSAADWDFAERSTRLPAEIKPKRDVVAPDGHKLTLGDTTLSLHLTPGHTPGTISTIFTVKDGARSHTVATWGGTSFNFQLSPEAFQIYIKSAVSFQDVVKQAGADIILSNHTIFDGSLKKFAGPGNTQAWRSAPVCRRAGFRPALRESRRGVCTRSTAAVEVAIKC